MAQEFSYELTRFCYGTGVRNNEVLWTKLLHDDLHLIVRTDNQLDGTFSFRVIRHMEVLEALEADRYIDAAILTRRSLITRAGSIYPSQLPIHGVVGDINLAFRWTLASGESRRIQMTFRSRDACFEVARMFQQRGLELKEQRPSSSRPSTARNSLVAGDQERTNMSSSSHGRSLTSNQTQQHRDRVVGPQSLPDVPRPDFATAHSYQIEPAVTPTADDRSQRDSETGTFVRTQLAALADSSIPRPSTGEFWNRRQTTSAQPPQSLCSYNTDSNAVLRRSTSSLHNYIHHYHSKFDKVNVDTATVQSQTNPSTLHSGQHASGFGVSPRPNPAGSSTSLTSAPLETELGILSGSHRDSSARPSSESSRPCTGSLDLPALPKPKLKRDTSILRPLSQREALEERPVTTHAYGKRSSDEAFGHSQASENAFRPATGSSTGLEPAPTSSDPNAHAPQESVSGSARKVARTDSTVNPEPRHASPISKNAKVSNRESIAPPASDQASNNPSRSNGSSQLGPAQHLDNSSYLSLEEIARMDFETRRTVLDQFFISKLEDEGFRCLCESVADSWRRLGLGL
ncbi:hypothetical protein K431DRAFT_296923 [Polychaeton citri CBS 116435]|uniref:Uncharacterized protein n=1 Tax=Polychaeton citri CBS 116435 TaxID=1314669 RepID=A0A9P4Q261_9PEZI|nr:hypothetical protein K431DRAFT_296923 [Polychaeton citri CBS 116435]